MCSVIVLLLYCVALCIYILQWTKQESAFTLMFFLTFPPVEYAIGKIQVCWNVMA
jgi:hypothetical protein